MQAQYEIVAIGLFLFTNVVSWQNWTNFFLKIDTFSTLKNAELVSMLIWNLKSSVIWSDYLIYLIEIEIQFG
jgi:hypothetical protein